MNRYKYIPTKGDRVIWRKGSLDATIGTVDNPYPGFGRAVYVNFDNGLRVAADIDNLTELPAAFDPNPPTAADPGDALDLLPADTTTKGA